MKKLLFTFILMLGFVYAQAQEGFRLGVKGGVNYANITGKNADDNSEYKFGVNAGLVASYGLTDHIALRLEGFYSNKGYKYESTTTTNGIKTEIDQNNTINYIDLPLLLRVRAGGLFFDLGPQIGFLVGGKQKYKQKVRDANGNKIAGIDDIDEERSVRKSYEKNDFGYVAGIGYSFGDNLGIGLRYNGGIKTINRTENNDPNKLRNSVFQLHLEYLFGGN